MHLARGPLTGNGPLVFDNPLLPSPSQDPWVTWHEGEFLSVNTDGQRLFVRRSRDVTCLFRSTPICVWTPSRGGAYSRHLWAPELHRIDGKWHIYYAADDGLNRNHRIWLLEASGDDAAGKYGLRGRLETGGWAIDATLLRGDTGQLHVLWSGWQNDTHGPQNLYIAPMSDAATISGPPALLSRPTRTWEKQGAPICEGPTILRRGEVTCIVYSAGASWTTRSCLGMLVNRDGNYLDPASWQKIGPVFPSTPEVWGVGHCSFVRDPDSGTDLIFYHAKTRRRRGWRDRNIRAQAFIWGDDGLPCFSMPLAPPKDGGFPPLSS